MQTKGNYKLSPLQQQVARLILQGHESAEIGSMISAEVSYTRGYINKIAQQLVKLTGASNRFKAALQAQKDGML